MSLISPAAICSCLLVARSLTSGNAPSFLKKLARCVGAASLRVWSGQIGLAKLALRPLQSNLFVTSSNKNVLRDTEPMAAATASAPPQQPGIGKRAGQASAGQAGPAKKPRPRKCWKRKAGWIISDGSEVPKVIRDLKTGSAVGFLRTR